MIALTYDTVHHPILLCESTIMIIAFIVINTVQYDYVGLTGTITIQATLATTPADADWFDVDTVTVANQTEVKYVNFTGNFVYIRAKLVYTDGTVNSIRLNH